MINASGYQVQIFNVGTNKPYEEANVTTGFDSDDRRLFRDESISCGIKIELGQRYGIKVSVPQNRSHATGILVSILIDGNKGDQRQKRAWTLLEERFIPNQMWTGTTAPRSMVISDTVVERPSGELAESAFFFREFIIDEGLEVPDRNIGIFHKRYMGKITVTLQHGFLDESEIPRRMYGSMKNGRDLDAPNQSTAESLHHHTPCYTHMEMVNAVTRTDNHTENTRFRAVKGKYGRTFEFTFSYDNKPSADLEQPDNLEPSGQAGPSERPIPNTTTSSIDLSPASSNTEAYSSHNSSHNSLPVDENEAAQAQRTFPQNKGKRKADSQPNASASRKAKQVKASAATTTANLQIRQASRLTRSAMMQLQNAPEPADDLATTMQTASIQDDEGDRLLNQAGNQIARRSMPAPQRRSLNQLRYEAQLAAVKREEAVARAKMWQAKEEAFRHEARKLKAEQAVVEYLEAHPEETS
ncbi:uncharacterized protein BDZ99DRAFT_561193 [Mytilinidion resinicola]|uniref:Uncharacterized protein n=1 Tax=Mytilinidion resinicola TaxID=574789 RepID=A0A6A6YQH8_9PEZI|nr:uncharacterized protein BDZ99DRAFT_561193 [Mytilinidion resinicola]KAF2810788.1 hypothetical protein BDZ99DRAFT_561193 [Mytilinidion resinicola]